MILDAPDTPDDDLAQDLLEQLLANADLGSLAGPMVCCGRGAPDALNTCGAEFGTYAELNAHWNAVHRQPNEYLDREAGPVKPWWPAPIGPAKPPISTKKR